MNSFRGAYCDGAAMAAKTILGDFIIIFTRVIAVAAAIGIVVFFFMQANTVYSSSSNAKQEEEPQPTVGFTWYCDAGVLLYPNGPHSTPICVAYTPARKL